MASIFEYCNKVFGWSHVAYVIRVLLQRPLPIYTTYYVTVYRLLSSYSTAECICLRLYYLLIYPSDIRFKAHWLAAINTQTSTSSVIFLWECHFFIYTYFFKNTTRGKNNGLISKLPKKKSASCNWYNIRNTL